MRTFSNLDVRKAYEQLPVSHKLYAYQLRELVWDCVDDMNLGCEITETLKWGVPSYLPEKPRVGSTVRIDRFDDDHVALYFNCQSMLVEGFRTTFGDDVTYSKNRAVLFNLSDPLPESIVKTCVTRAFRYHLDKHLP